MARTKADRYAPPLTMTTKEGLSRRVWLELRRRRPMVETHAHEIERLGLVLDAMLQASPRFACLRGGLRDGMLDEDQWTLLAIAALSAVGKEPCEGETLRADGLWIGQDPAHPAVVARHAGCAQCAAGALPCPIQGYPMAHVDVGCT